MSNAGYPTDEEIKAIEHAEPAEALRLMEAAWAKGYGSAVHFWLHDRGEYRFATGGWSGNEELIEALGRNAIAYAMTWNSSHRGGLHIFEVRR